MTSPTASHDLTRTILPYLDRHLAFSFLLDVGDMATCPFSAPSMAKAQYTVISGTKLYPDLMDLAEKVFTGDDLVKKKEDLKRKMEELKAQHARLVETPTVALFLKNVATAEGRERLQAMIKDGTVANEGRDAFGFSSAAQLKDLMSYGRAIYEYQQYDKCSEVLRFLRYVDPVTYKAHEGRLWGQLACNITLCLSGADNVTWKDTVTDLAAVSDMLDTTTCSLSAVMYFLHWSLFVMLKSGLPQGRDQLLEVFMSEKYAHVLCTSAPHLLRYVCVSILTTKAQRRGGRMHSSQRELLRILEFEGITYRDPIVDVFVSLFIKCDTTAALDGLKACDVVLVGDYFLAAYKNEFMDAAKRVIFEDVCRVHNVVDITKVSKRLGMTVDEAEKWLVNIIRPARINAKVDEAARRLTVQSEITTPSASHLLMEKSKFLSFRVQALYKTCLDARSGEAAPEATK